MATTTMTETEIDALDPSRWTTPQELSLLQSLTHYKPAGMHRHFRMISILNSLLTSGTVPNRYGDQPHASSTAGIWRKLGSLYDLKALDEREDAIFSDAPADDGELTAEYWREFELLGYDFQARMWERRLAETVEVWSDDNDDGDLPEVRLRESTVADSDDMRSSPVGSARGTRMSGRRAAVGRRLAEVKQEESPAAGSGKGSRRTSKAASPSVKDEEDTEMRDADQEDDEESEDDDEDSEQDDTEDDSRKGRSTRGRGARRGARGRRGRRGK